MRASGTKYKRLISVYHHIAAESGLPVRTSPLVNCRVNRILFRLGNESLCEAAVRVRFVGIGQPEREMIVALRIPETDIVLAARRNPISLDLPFPKS